MRVNAIPKINCNKYTKCVSKPQSNESTIEQVSKPEVSQPYYRPIFGASRVDIAKLVYEAPFDDKLAAAFGQLSNQDLLVVSPKIKSLKQILANAFNNIPIPISRLFYLKEPTIAETLLFAKSFDGTKKIWNVNETPVMLNGFEAVLPNETSIIEDGDRIRLSQRWCEIKQKPDLEFNLGKYTSYFLQSFDYSKQSQDLVQTHNRKILTDIVEGQSGIKKKSLSFADVGGQDENIDILKKNVLFPMKYPEVFKGFLLNRGVILSGPPGTGKTLLAKALVAEAGASSFELCATDLAAKYVGESEQNCRDLFQAAVDAQPSIIYFDEFDALAKSRGSVDVHGDKLLNQLLSLMSDLEKRGDNVFVIASTNRKDSLDPAILRSGRFGLHLEVNAPDLEGTRQILKIHTKDKPLDKKLDLDILAENMHNLKMTGVEIADVVKRAFSNALERAGIYKSMEENRFSITMMDYLSINEEDFSAAMKGFKPPVASRRRIGFSK